MIFFQSCKAFRLVCLICWLLLFPCYPSSVKMGAGRPIFSRSGIGFQFAFPSSLVKNFFLNRRSPVVVELVEMWKIFDFPYSHKPFLSPVPRPFSPVMPKRTHLAKPATFCYKCPLYILRLYKGHLCSFCSKLLFRK